MSESKRYGVVYKITNTVNQKIYVGQTRKKLAIRWLRHQKDPHCRMLHEAICEHGASAFTVEEIAVARSPYELNALEAYWIEELGSLHPHGYNRRKRGWNHRGSVRHGMTETKVWRAWKKMRERCKPDAHCAHNYAARGITVKFKSFEEFYAEVGDPPPGTTLDRIDNNRSYEPGNVRWATRSEQLLNRRVNHHLTYGGQTLTLMQWARKLGIHKSTIISRLTMGWPVEKALTPVSEPTLTYQGKMQTIAQWAETTGLEKEIIQHRLTRGWSVERALTQPLRKRKDITPSLFAN